MNRNVPFYPLITELTSIDAAVVANGTPPASAEALRLLRMAPYVACCDGAIYEAEKLNIKVNAVVGDGDSISPELRIRYGADFHHISEQDDNDLTKATRFLKELKKGPDIAYFGCTGRREDHTLGNISLMVRYLQDFQLRPVMATDEGWFVPAQGTARFGTAKGQQVSIFNFGCKNMEASGLHYPARAFASWWEGTLNEATDDVFEIRADGYYLVFRTYLNASQA